MHPARVAPRRKIFRACQAVDGGEFGSHTIAIGTVAATMLADPGPPLICHDGDFLPEGPD